MKALLGPYIICLKSRAEVTKSYISGYAILLIIKGVGGYTPIVRYLVTQKYPEALWLGEEFFWSILDMYMFVTFAILSVKHKKNLHIQN